MPKSKKCKSCKGATKLCGGIVKYRPHANSSFIGSSSHECEKCKTRYGYKKFGQNWPISYKQQCRVLICVKTGKIAGHCEDK